MRGRDSVRSMDDATTCPGCGEEVAYEAQETRVLTGTCSGCHRVTTLVEGPLPLGTPPSGVASPGPPAAAAATGPECAECGSVLSISAREDGLLEVSCSECETTTTFVPQGSEAPERPRERSGGFDRPRRRSGPMDAAPNARPCRQCGAPLTFTTDDAGTLTGECASCGNRFTLPPRREERFGRTGDRRGGGGGYAGRGPPRYGRSPGRWTDRGGAGRDGYRRDSRPYRSRDDDRSDPKRRRRPRRDSDER
jgi:DNA-directed RNA polymerase subunit M/transcription elongation factor TFIIS